uniref:Uncharacterized protein n=1 Tax=Romanomermis culicivorax TaxID=13658 RepID=A0A915KQT1_ROMCU
MKGFKPRRSSIADVSQKKDCSRDSSLSFLPVDIHFPLGVYDEPLWGKILPKSRAFVLESGKKQNQNKMNSVIGQIEKRLKLLIKRKLGHVKTALF